MMGSVAGEQSYLGAAYFVEGGHECPGARGQQPLAPDRVYRLTIGLAHIHHTLRAGSRIEINVTSSNFPRRARNTNSGHRLLAGDTAADIRIARNTVHHAPTTPSYIELPCHTLS